jgi:nucleoside-diphosphate-sugar epimerase
MAKLFITNATGYIGSAVAQEFKNAGYEVTALARSEESAKKLEERGYKVQRGDIKNVQSFIEKAKEADVVINTAASYDQDFEKSEREVVDAVLKALKGTGKTFIYTSGVWTYGNTGGKTVDETAPTGGPAFVQFRPEVEKKVIAAKNDLKALVIRPGVVYGGGAGIFAGWYKEAAQKGALKIVGDGENHLTLVHVEDLAKLYLLIAQKGKSGEIYNGTNDKSVKYKEVAEQIAKTAGVPGKVQTWPLQEAIQAIGPFAEGFALDQVVTSEKAKKELGWQPKAPDYTLELSKKHPVGAQN